MKKITEPQVEVIRIELLDVIETSDVVISSILPNVKTGTFTSSFDHTTTADDTNTSVE